jgi:hypothetical protein
MNVALVESCATCSAAADSEHHERPLYLLDVYYCHDSDVVYGIPSISESEDSGVLVTGSILGFLHNFLLGVLLFCIMI